MEDSKKEERVQRLLCMRFATDLSCLVPFSLFVLQSVSHKTTDWSRECKTSRSQFQKGLRSRRWTQHVINIRCHLLNYS